MSESRPIHWAVEMHMFRGTCRRRTPVLFQLPPSFHIWPFPWLATYPMSMMHSYLPSSNEKGIQKGAWKTRQWIIVHCREQREKGKELPGKTKLGNKSQRKCSSGWRDFGRQRKEEMIWTRLCKAELGLVMLAPPALFVVSSGRIHTGHMTPGEKGTTNLLSSFSFPLRPVWRFRWKDKKELWKFFSLSVLDFFLSFLEHCVLSGC